uniref:Uncharacterized protein n=2 Tax=Tetranychus urticae TaxID=32264 RepID=T1KBY8_TETUR
MDPDSLERRKSPPDTPTDDSLPPISFKRHYRTSQIRPSSSRMDFNRSDSRSESRCFHRPDSSHEKDFIEWTPSKRYDLQNESLRSRSSVNKTLKSYRGLSDLRIGNFDWQWKVLRTGHGSYSPNESRSKKKTLSEDGPSFDQSLGESPSSTSSQRFPESREMIIDDHKAEKEETVNSSYSSAWTGGPTQYHLADDLISLERRSQVSNWGRLPFYDN